jgi:CubicO group peptidase (beta-lactamase class C family)
MASMKKTVFIIAMLWCSISKAQSYFPPLTGSTWDTLSPSTLGWCADSINNLYAFLDAKNTKGFIVLKDGKLVLEKYFGSFTKDSVWYWASAGKSLTSALVGIAQEQNLLDINNPVATYCGTAWTTAPAAKEQLITVKNLLSMTSGLQDNVPNNDCTADTCFQYLADADTRWAYHNGAYYKLFDVLSNATSSTINAYTNTSIKNKIGMQGLWLQGAGGAGFIYYSNARSMARFGLLAASNYIWNSDTILKDVSYKTAMRNTSQNFNKSYGYLWWLNGKGSFMSPGTQFVFNTNLVNTAPADMFAAMGKNDQRIYIVPSQKLVVVRIGNAADGSVSAISAFDEELWANIQNLSCAPLKLQTYNALENIIVYPNPTSNYLVVQAPYLYQQIQLVSVFGNVVLNIQSQNLSTTLNLEDLPNGIYTLKIKSEHGFITKNIIKY